MKTKEDIINQIQHHKFLIINLEEELKALPVQEVWVSLFQQQYKPDYVSNSLEEAQKKCAQYKYPMLLGHFKYILAS